MRLQHRLVPTSLGALAGPLATFDCDARKRSLAGVERNIGNRLYRTDEFLHVVWLYVLNFRNLAMHVSAGVLPSHSASALGRILK